jgi:hypothetical protein
MWPKARMKSKPSHDTSCHMKATVATKVMFTPADCEVTSGDMSQCIMGIYRSKSVTYNRPCSVLLRQEYYNEWVTLPNVLPNALPNAVVGELRIRKIPGSNFGPGIDYPQFFVGFLSPSRRIPGQCLKLGHDRFLPNSSQFVRFQVLTAASMKFRVFWDVARYSHVESDTFQRCTLPPSSGPWWCWQSALLKRRLTSTWLHGATSQKTQFFFQLIYFYRHFIRRCVAWGT